MDVLHLTLRQLQIFASVARLGTTTAAAEEISLSQSAVSSALAELERMLSLQLFDRAGKRLVLNENGRALLPRALALLDNAAAIEQMPHDSGAQIGSLRIGASTTLGNYVLPALLAQFLAPLVDSRNAWQSRVAIGNTATICREIANFALDIGLIEGPCHEADVEVTPWLRDELLIVAAPSYPLAATPAPVRIELLRDAVWLLREAGSGTREATDQQLLPRLRQYRRSLELGSSEAIKHAAAQGLGIAVLSRWVVQDLLDSGGLVTLSTTLPRLYRQCYWVIHRDKQPTPILEAFLAIAAMAGMATTGASGAESAAP